MRVSRQEAAPLQLNTAAPQKLRSAGTYDRGSYRKLTAVFYALFRAAAQRQKGVFMAFFNSAVGVLQTLVIALGAGLGIWGVINLLEGYGNDNRATRS